MRNRATLLILLLATLQPVLCRAQDASRPVDPDGRASVHQWGIIRSGEAVNSSDLLDLPSFAHTRATTTTAPEWLDFSAIYFNPPQMTTAPLVFDVRQSISGLGGITAWYPYSPNISDRSIEWHDVRIGVMADGLKTRHPIWMTARSMEAAATVKVYKPGPPGSKPDDEGTTEGDVFLFMRGRAIGDAPVRARYLMKTDEWSFSNLSIRSDSVPLFTTGTRQAWLAQSNPDGEITARKVMMNLPFQTSATVSERSSTRTSAELRAQLNESITGNGLLPDEADAQAKLVIQSLGKMTSPALVYILSPQWIDKRFGLKITGPAEKPVRVFLVILKLPHCVCF